jgi:hypothetical protein
MRVFSALLLVSLGLAACTPFIPVKDDFATSALVPTGDIPPEFGEFNAYQAAVNPLLADQICATPYQFLEEKTVGATPGQLLQARARCQTHIPLLGP